MIPLTKPKLIKLLRPRFSDEGSNIREKEIAVYRTFLEYLKEVTGELATERILSAGVESGYFKLLPEISQIFFKSMWII